MGQSDIERRRRLKDGKCPTHGTALAQKEVVTDKKGNQAVLAACTRTDCAFEAVETPDGWSEVAGN